MSRSNVIVRGAVMAALTLLFGAAPASADTAVLKVLTTTGESDPAAGVPRVLTVSGATSLPEQVFVAYRAPGGAPCAPTAYSDSGTYLSTFGSGDGRYTNGAFGFQQVVTWEKPGDVVFCIWLAQDQYTITTPIAQTVTFRAPTATITGSVNPTGPRPRERATLTVSGATETPTYVYATLRKAGGAPCAPTWESDTGTSLIKDMAVNGAFTTDVTVTQRKRGTYLVCLWLASSSSSPSIAGPQPLTFTVGTPPPPPPPCVVPSVPFNASLGSVKRRIRSAHCRVGSIVRVHSRRVRREAVIRLRPRSRTQLANGARVGVVVSSGPRRHRHRHHR